MMKKQRYALNLIIKKTGKIEIDQILERLYLIILALFWLFYWGYTIMYPVEWPRINYNFLRGLLIIYTIIKYAYTRNSAFDKKELFLVLVLLVAFVFASFNNGYTELLDIVFLIIGAKNFNYIHILKLYLLLKVPLIIATMLGSQLGIIENLVYNQNGRIRVSYGFIYPTDFAAQVFFVIIVWILVRQIQISFVELVVILIISGFLLVNCDARCSVISIILSVAGVLVLKIVKRIKIAEDISIFFQKSICTLTVIMPYICSVFMILMCRFYNPQNTFMAIFNEVTSQRLKLGKKTFDNFDVKIFGQYIEMVGNGGTTQKPIDYTFIDCSYINILMRFGLVTFIAVIFLLNYIAIKYWKNAFILYILMLVCIHSIMEQHLLDMQYNILVLLPFCSIRQIDKTGQCSFVEKQFLHKNS